MSDQKPIFDIVSQRKHIAAELAKVEPGHGMAHVSVRFPDGTASIIVAHRINEHALVAGEAGWDFKVRGPFVAAELVASW